MKFVIPDVHGCIKTLEALIEKLDLSEEDTVYQLGDNIDRGPHSKEVLDFWIDKTNKFPKNFVVARGNHDEWMAILYKAFNEGQLSRMGGSYNSWLGNGGRTTLASFGVTDITAIPPHYIEWVNSLPTCIELEKFVLVHGGLNLYLEDPVNQTSPDDMMWERPYGEKTFDVKWPLLGKQLVVGHTIRTLDQIKTMVENDANILMIDNGCFVAHQSGMSDCTIHGNLIALKLDDKSLIIQKNVDIK